MRYQLDHLPRYRVPISALYTVANQLFEGLIMRRTGLSLALFGLLAVVSLPTTSAHAQATRTWVSGVGDDVNPCSRTAPCKTFAGAISKTAAGGEIDCLDPGGFGAVTITKSMTIDCTGVSGGILSALSNGVIINAGINDKVVLRNLVIQGTSGASIGVNGIRWLAGRELVVDRVVVQGFSTTGLDVSKSALGNLSVTDSRFTHMPIAIRLATTAGNLVASIDGVKIYNLTGNGIQAASANVFANVSNSVISLPAAGGIGVVVSASGAFMNVESTVFSNNIVGASASVSGATIRLSNNTFWDCGTAVNAVAGASFLSANNNKVGGGNAGSAPTGTITIK